MVTPADVLRQHLEDALSGRKFDPRQVRTSEIGLCGRKVVFHALNPERRDRIQAIYSLSGRMLERRAYEALKAAYPSTEEQVIVRHPWGESHPDIWVPELGWYVECKGASAAAARSKALKPHHRDQVQATWGFWRDAGGCFTADGRWIPGVPTHAFILLQSREDWGETVAANQVRWDGERFERLRGRMDERDVQIACEIIPPREKKRPDFECFDQRTGEVRCPLYEDCWPPQAA